MTEQTTGTSETTTAGVVALVEKSLEQQAGVPISQMTPAQVVEAMVAASSAPQHASGRGGEPATPMLARWAQPVSSDPILQDRQVRDAAAREMERLRRLLETSAQLSVEQLLKDAIAPG